MGDILRLQDSLTTMDWPIIKHFFYIYLSFVDNDIFFRVFNVDKFDESIIKSLQILELYINCKITLSKSYSF